jgi:hypothetical protein
METSFEKAHCPKTKAVKVGGREYVMQPLSLRQLFQIGVFAGTLPNVVRERIAARADQGTSEIIGILTCLDDRDIAQVIGILLRAIAPEDLARFEGATLEEVSEMALALTEINDLAKVAANFLKAAEIAKGLRTMMPSPPSSRK